MSTDSKQPNDRHSSCLDGLLRARVSEAGRSDELNKRAAIIAAMHNPSSMTVSMLFIQLRRPGRPAPATEPSRGYASPSCNPVVVLRQEDVSLPEVIVGWPGSKRLPTFCGLPACNPKIMCKHS
jgi:hypothetical protein